MPELPEIIIIREGLKEVLPGKRIENIVTQDNYPLNPNKVLFNDYALGATITSVFNIAKLIVLELSSGYYLCAHLKMTGNILYNTADEYVKITILLNDGNQLHYSSIRKLGYFEIWDKEKLDAYASRVGKTALESNLEPHEFISLIKRKKTNIRNALLDQSLISGIGNIYANDALFLSKIHPKTPVPQLKESELHSLFMNIKKVLKLGIKNKGSSMNRYKDIFGHSGTHQHHFYVYGKKGNTCTQCQVQEIKSEKLQGRGIYFCPNCQIEPNL